MASDVSDADEELHSREDQLVLREPVAADDAAGAGYRRVDSGQAATDGDDAGGADGAVCGGLGLPNAHSPLKHPAIPVCMFTGCQALAKDPAK